MPPDAPSFQPPPANPYHLLGLPSGASMLEVEKAYHEGQLLAAQAMQEQAAQTRLAGSVMQSSGQAAYQLLRDAEWKAQYDQYLREQPSADRGTAAPLLSGEAGESIKQTPVGPAVSPWPGRFVGASVVLIPLVLGLADRSALAGAIIIGGLLGIYIVLVRKALSRLFNPGWGTAIAAVVIGLATLVFMLAAATQGLAALGIGTVLALGVLLYRTPEQRRAAAEVYEARLHAEEAASVAMPAPGEVWLALTPSVQNHGATDTKHWVVVLEERKTGYAVRWMTSKDKSRRGDHRPISPEIQAAMGLNAKDSSYICEDVCVLPRKAFIEYYGRVPSNVTEPWMLHV